MNEETLNRHDVEILAKKTNVETKSTIANKVASYYRTSKITAQEAKIAEDIFRIMVRDTEIIVREVLSESLKKCTHLPQDIIECINVV